MSPVSAPNDITFDILLAEDNLVNQKLAVKILEKYGHSVEIAENVLCENSELFVFAKVPTVLVVTEAHRRHDCVREIFSPHLKRFVALHHVF